jgi:hypothetical protein
VSGNAGFDFNAWQALNQQHGTPQSAAEAQTPDSVTQGGIDQVVQSFFRVFGVNPDLKGHAAVIGETNVGSGLSLQNAAVLKDRPGAEGTAPGAAAPGDGEHGEATATSPLAEMHVSPQLSAIPGVAGTLPAANPVDIPMDRLSYLRPPSSPVVNREGVEVAMAV